MIIPAQIRHLNDINRIYNQAVEDGLRTAHTEPLSLDEHKKWLNKHSRDTYPVFVYLKDNNVVGWISISPYRSDRKALNEIVEVSYYVDYEHHGQGIGTELMNRAVRFCREAEYRLIIAILIEQNRGSLKLLDKFEFQEGGRIPDAIHFNNTFRDHIYLYKKLQV